MKDKKYFIAVKFLFYGILIINLLLIFISVNRSSTAVLILSQFTFILFICIAWVLLKRTFSVFFTNLFVMMDKMMNGEAVPNLTARVTGLKMKPFEEGLKVAFVPSKADLEKAKETGRKFAESM